MPKSLRVAVFGAGAFGGWTALELVRRGASVTLIDAWGPGNIRSSSGGDTRVVRATYGTHVVYTRMAARALMLWRDHDARYGQRLFRRTGAVWMFGHGEGGERFSHASTDTLRAQGITVEAPTLAESQRRYPQIDLAGVSSVLVEPEAGYVFARRACEHVVDCLVGEGGDYVQAAAAAPVVVDRANLTRVTLSDGASIQADAYVFACGPWLPSLFPDVVGSLITPTRQEVYYFGTPPGDSRFLDDHLPVWLDFGERCLYGIPGTMNRAFKIADDSAGPPMDPTGDDRIPSHQGISAARAFLARRFPALAGAPLVASEVCQYESTPDANLIVERHPRASNVWIVGGGSGHGFKMGPVIGEMVASLVLGESEPDPYFGLERFASPPPGGWKPKWA